MTILGCRIDANHEAVTEAKLRRHNQTCVIVPDTNIEAVVIVSEYIDIIVADILNELLYIRPGQLLCAHLEIGGERLVVVLKVGN